MTAERTAWESEHEDDMPDHADAFALLDDGIIRAPRCPHCCNFICTCEDDSMNEWRKHNRVPNPKRWDRT